VPPKSLSLLECASMLGRRERKGCHAWCSGRFSPSPAPCCPGLHGPGLPQAVGHKPLHIPGMRILSVTTKQGPNIMFFVSNRRHILFISVAPQHTGPLAMDRRRWLWQPMPRHACLSVCPLAAYHMRLTVHGLLAVARLRIRWRVAISRRRSHIGRAIRWRRRAVRWRRRTRIPRRRRPWRPGARILSKIDCSPSTTNSIQD
jgi:hypothetical protein